MPLTRRKTGGIPSAVATLAALILTCSASPSHALRFVEWNLWEYPNGGISTRQAAFRTVVSGINADLIIVQELNSAAGRDSFLTNVLTAWRLNITFVNTNPPVIALTNALEYCGTIGTNEAAYFVINVPLSAQVATNFLVSASGDVHLIYNPSGVPIVS